MRSENKAAVFSSLLFFILSIFSPYALAYDPMDMTAPSNYQPTTNYQPEASPDPDPSPPTPTGSSFSDPNGTPSDSALSPPSSAGTATSTASSGNASASTQPATVTNPVSNQTNTSAYYNAPPTPAAPVPVFDVAGGTRTHSCTYSYGYGTCFVTVKKTQTFADPAESDVQITQEDTYSVMEFFEYNFTAAQWNRTGFGGYRFSKEKGTSQSADLTITAWEVNRNYSVDSNGETKLDENYNIDYTKKETQNSTMGGIPVVKISDTHVINNLSMRFNAAGSETSRNGTKETQVKTRTLVPPLSSTSIKLAESETVDRVTYYGTVRQREEYTLAYTKTWDPTDDLTLIGNSDRWLTENRKTTLKAYTSYQGQEKLTYKEVKDSQTERIRLGSVVVQGQTIGGTYHVKHSKVDERADSYDQSGILTGYWIRFFESTWQPHPDGHKMIPKKGEVLFRNYKMDGSLDFKYTRETEYEDASVYPKKLVVTFHDVTPDATRNTDVLLNWSNGSFDNGSSSSTGILIYPVNYADHGRVMALLSEYYSIEKAWSVPEDQIWLPSREITPWWYSFIPPWNFYPYP